MKNKPSTDFARTRLTIDHEEIRHWAEERGGCPTFLRNARGPGHLGIDFPGITGRLSMDPVPWKTFFQQFEDDDLAFVYQDGSRSGELSLTYKLIRRPPDSDP